MEPTLYVRLSGEVVKVPAFDEDTRTGFDGSQIILSLAGPDHPKIWAANNVKKNEDGSYVGVIHLNSQALELPATHRKVILAHEWIEVLMAMRDGQRPKTMPLGKVELALLYNTLHMRSPWQDPPDFELQLHQAIRYLLVTKASLEELAYEFGTSLSSIVELVKTNPSEAGTLIRQLANTYSAKWSVDLPLVFDRLQESLWDLVDEVIA